ncbi:MAG: ribosome recycling factor [Planctomycetes bacterium]|nr:ribosome recycling factor [Planctomycetota bacterium]MCB9888820.1 ribosome recycling factor [Planctomycetota bacterium]
MEEAAAQILQEFEEKLDRALHHLVEQFGTIRTGRAAPALVDHVKVNYYGSMTPLNQLAHISVPEARQILVKPFDASALKEIERALLGSDLGLTPSNEGKQLRLTLPPLSEEQRKKIQARCREIAEASRVAMRNGRRDANKHADAAKDSAHLSKDSVADLHDSIQELLKAKEKQVDEALDKKTKEIMEE